MSKVRRVIMDLDLMNETFEIINGELWRIGGRKNQPILGYKASFYDRDGIKKSISTQRIIYAIKNNISDFDFLHEDDNGELRPMPTSIISLLSLSNRDKIYTDPNSNRGWVARVQQSITNKRLTKTFREYDDAVKWQDKITKKIWSKELNKYNVYNSYFN